MLLKHIQNFKEGICFSARWLQSVLNKFPGRSGPSLLSIVPRLFLPSSFLLIISRKSRLPDHTDAESNGPDMQQTARLEQPVSSPSSEHEYDHQVDVDFPDAADATGSADIDIDSRPAPPAELFGSQALHPASVSSPSQSIPHLTASQHNQNTDPVGEQDSDTDDDEDDDADMVLDVQQGAAPAHEMPPDQALLRRDCSPLCISIGNGWFIMQDYEPSGVQGHPGTCVLAACSLGQYMCLLIITFKLAHKCCLVCSVT